MLGIDAKIQRSPISTANQQNRITTLKNPAKTKNKTP
jgi:hypothetical protein